MSKAKSVDRTFKRIIKKLKTGDYDPEVILHMLQSLVESRDRKIRHLEGKARNRKFVLNEKQISGALRSCIDAHGPITKEFIGSAAKRIYNGCIHLADSEEKTEDIT